jgi:hypothetical protein
LRHAAPPTILLDVNGLHIDIATTETDMTPAPAQPATAPAASWFARAEAWLDARGTAAWIAAMVLGFIAFWPIGLALLAYMIWSKRMFTGTCARRRGGFRARAASPSGNSAFDAYREETLRRLEEEQEAFQAFLERLRAAKDKAEFDAFMEERARARAGAADDGDAPDEDARPEQPA